MPERIRHAKKIVIKIGTSILKSQKESFSRKEHHRVCQEIYALIKKGYQPVLVSSGAIALGMKSCGFKKRPKSMAELQACAAIGQGKLMHAYESFFAKRKVHTAQLLLTRDGLEDRKRFLCARNTLVSLLKMNVLPIVNENDTIAVEEIAFGDNDILSVHVANLIGADLLINLSDAEGFLLTDGTRVRQVTSESDIDSKLLMHLVDKSSEETVGGMRAKLKAARVAMRLGIPFMIVNGHRPHILSDIMGGKDVGTLFIATSGHKDLRKKWIAFSATRQGAIVVDNGAYRALLIGKKSLLPGGIVKVKGNFKEGQVVELETGEGKIFGRGVTSYQSDDLIRIAGKKTGQIQEILGKKFHDEVIHRNNLVLWGE
ncbi:MAG TPA: glutamate 5-kinase [Candidatus Omnitrophota bacterium]|nr:glutamate 5-kinase [Candidatus Omnitrophota bacterium]